MPLRFAAVRPPRGDLESVDVCHCPTLSASHGGRRPFRLRLSENSSSVEGDNNVYERDTASGLKIRFHFCPNCGSNVFSEGDRSPNSYGITVGSFADPDFPPPTLSIWEEAMHPWLEWRRRHSTSRRNLGDKGVGNAPCADKHYV